MRSGQEAEVGYRVSSWARVHEHRRHPSRRALNKHWETRFEL